MSDSANNLPSTTVAVNRASYLHTNSLRNTLNTPDDWQDPFMPFDPSKLPPLLEIPCPELASRAVRHKNAHQEESNQQYEGSRRYEFMRDSYEVLEGVGDAILAGAVCRILLKRYPDLTTGPLFDLRERLVRNDTISYLSLAYDLPSRLEFDPLTRVNKRQSVAADLFEAHIGALIQYEDRGGKVIGLDTWLFDIFSPSVWPTMESTAAELKARKLEQDHLRLEQKRRKDNLAGRTERWKCARCDLELSSVLVPPKFVFDTVDSDKGWHAKLYLDGQFTSCGRSKNKKDAEFAAAINHVRGLRPPTSANES
ncbi:hypothetical protein JCM5353_006785 [Sporobolomyces roseus]